MKTLILIAMTIIALNATTFLHKKNTHAVLEGGKSNKGDDANEVCNDACTMDDVDCKDKCLPCLKGSCEQELQNTCNDECMDCLSCHVGMKTGDQDMVAQGVCYDACHFEEVNCQEECTSPGCHEEDGECPQQCEKCEGCLECHTAFNPCVEACDFGWCEENCMSCAQCDEDGCPDDCDHEQCEARCTDCVECHVAREPCMKACDFGWCEDNCRPCLKDHTACTKEQWAECGERCTDCLDCHDMDVPVAPGALGVCFDACDEGWCYENCEACKDGMDAEGCDQQCENRCTDCLECHLTLDPCMGDCDFGWCEENCMSCAQCDEDVCPDDCDQEQCEARCNDCVDCHVAREPCLEDCDFGWCEDNCKPCLEKKGACDHEQWQECGRRCTDCLKCHGIEEQ